MVLLRRGRGHRCQPARRRPLRRARPADPAFVSAIAPLPPPPLDDPAFVANEPVPRTNWQLFRRRFFRHRLALLSITILVILMIACYGATWLAPHKQNAQDLLQSDLGPSSKHLFGTDDL